MRSFDHATVEIVRFAKAQFATAVATLLEWIVVLILAQLGMWHVAAAFTGAVLGGITDFVIKKSWVFASGSAIRYAVVSGLSSLWFSATVYLLVDLLHWHLSVAVVGASVLVGILWNYPLHRFFVFTAASGHPA